MSICVIKEMREVVQRGGVVHRCECRPEGFDKLSPLGKVPVLVVAEPDGSQHVLWEFCVCSVDPTHPAVPIPFYSIPFLFTC